jgi:patatin-like phospholipase/acyl hydrolase
MYPLRVLSIDGGGIRGIIPLKILAYIEQKTGKPIHQLFNSIGGTSTGGIIALGLNTYKPGTKEVYTVKELMEFYTRDAHELFSYRWESFGGWLLSSYRAKNIEKYLQDKFGKNTLLAELPTTGDCDVRVYSYDLKHNQPFEFTNQDRHSRHLVWQAARATSAAPTFFPAFNFQDPDEENPGKENPRVLIDGGVFINNPALNLLLEARKIRPHIKQQSQLLVSIGTGDFSPYKKPLESSGKLGWAGSIFGVTSTATSSEAHEQLKELLNEFDPRVPYDEQELEELTKTRYYRFQKQFDKDVPMDGISKKQIKRLEQLGDELVKQEKDKLDKLCATLTKPMDITDSDVIK